MKISVVSYRGGSGKSLLSLNLANYFLENAILVETDFLAPSLHYLVDTGDKFWNDYLLDHQSLGDVKSNFRGIDIICTRPNDEAILSKIHDKSLWSKQFSDKIINFMTVAEKKYDYIIVDNQGGLFLSTIVHSFFSDILLMVIRPDKYDVLSSIDYIKNFNKDFYIVWNQVLDHPKIEDQIDQWEKNLFEPIDQYQGTLSRIPFDQETAYKRWIEGKALIYNTEYADLIKEIGEKLEQIRSDTFR